MANLKRIKNKIFQVPPICEVTLKAMAFFLSRRKAALLLFYGAPLLLSLCWARVKFPIWYGLILQFRHFPTCVLISNLGALHIPSPHHPTDANPRIHACDYVSQQLSNADPSWHRDWGGDEEKQIKQFSCWLWATCNLYTSNVDSIVYVKCPWNQDLDVFARFSGCGELGRQCRSLSESIYVSKKNIYIHMLTCKYTYNIYIYYTIYIYMLAFSG